MITENDNSQSDDMELMKKQIARLTTLIKQKDDKIKTLSAEINSIKSDELGNALGKKDFDAYDTSDVNKEVVKLYANGFGSGFIYTTLNEKKGRNISMQEIEEIVYGLNFDPYSISIDLVKYYNECKAVFEEQKISKGIFANSILQKIDLIEEAYSRIQIRASEAGDYKEERMILDSLKALQMDRAKTFSKNVLGIFESGMAKGDDYGDDYKKLKEQYEDGGTSDNKKILKIVKRAN